MIRNVLSIAGSDPSGGAGVQADLKTFAACGCYGMAAITALTAQNTQGVRAIHAPPPEFLAAQLEAIDEDIRIDAVKIGMLGSAAAIAVVAAWLARVRPPFVVLDPVLAATSGDSLGGADVADAMRTLFPLATLVTPNAPEAARLTGAPDAHDIATLRAHAHALVAMGARAALVKGGHIRGALARDVLATATGERVFEAPWVETRNTHGTGCTLSAAIAAYLARGLALEAAVEAGKAYVTHALQGAAALDVGHGHGPLDHFHACRGGRSSPNLKAPASRGPP